MSDDRSTDPVWQRIDGWLRANRKTWTWLGDRLSEQGQPIARSRIGNWTKRGVPASMHAGIAYALGESVDWLHGTAPPKSDDAYKISPMALKLAQEFDRIQDERKQLDVFAQAIASIYRALGI